MDLLGRHIFKTGTWNGIKFTEKDLDDIVNNFATLKDVHNVPLKFGHNTKQPLTDGQPALGWIDRVYRKGEDLYADFSNVPTIVMDAINSKKYRTTSIEVIKNAKHNGKKIKSWILDAVALLGADQPAVSGLQDLADLSFARVSFENGESVTFSKAGTFNSNEEDGMTPEELASAIAKALKPLEAQLSETNEKVTKLEASNKTLTDENTQLKSDAESKKKDEDAEKVKASREAANVILDGAVRQKVITPAQREVHEATFGVKDDEKVMSIDLEQLKTVTGFKAPKKDEKSETFSRDEEDEMDDNIPLDQQVVNATHKVQANSPDLDYAEAQQFALRADPKLARAYADSNGEVGGAQ